MAEKFSLPNVQIHSRSISLPARLHPSLTNIASELNNLRVPGDNLRPGGVAAESIRAGLIGLAELYNSIEDVISSPCTQQAIHKQQHVKMVEEALDRSVGLLDACSNARELLSNMEDRVHELQSALRRRPVRGGGGDCNKSSMEIKIHAYMSFRKKSKKDIAKCLRELKRMDTSIESLYMPVDPHHEQMFMVTKLLRESSASTTLVFRSILLFFSMKTKARGWSLIRKLMIPAPPSDHHHTSQQIFNEVGSIDIAIYSLHRKIRKSDEKIDVQIALRRLEKLDVSMRGIESGLDCLFRRLIQNRVTLLNILTP